jgi:serine/threonine-protein kinase
LGATFYFVVTGQVPPEAIERITGKTDKLIPPRSINPTIPPFLEQVILKAMRVNREERFSSVKEMLTALQTGQVTFSQQPKPTPARSAPSTPRIAPLPEGVSLAPSWLRFIAFFLDILIWSAGSWMLILGYALLLSAASGGRFLVGLESS